MARRARASSRACTRGRKRTSDRYGAADFFVLATLYDPFPNAALEALASGLPIVVSRQSGAAELVREGVNGHVVDALDVEALAAAMAHRRRVPWRGARASVTLP
jgi:UDP-glucose:(heptosyl)LPS alpha-1,3-glucosyltransferase